MEPMSDITLCPSPTLSLLRSMNAMVHRTMCVVWGVLLLALGTSGCRTYGGYGSTGEMHEKIQQATQRFAEELERARGEQQALQRAAAANPALTEFAERFAAIVENQEEVVAEQQVLAEEAPTGGNLLFAWVGPDTYRRLHSTYGAIISEQQIIRDGYARVLMDLQQAVGAMTSDQEVPLQSRYQVRPQFYERIRYASGKRSVADILAQAQAPAPADAAPDAQAAPSE